MKRLALIVTFAVVALGVMLPTFAQDAPAPEPFGIRPDAPPYAVHGPYWVGTRDFVIDDGAGIPLPVTVWYPALNPEGLPESLEYQPLIKWVPWPEGDFPVQGHALGAADPDASGAPYPVVVFSHGYTAFPASFATLLEHLASYGFVVLAPDHNERWYFEADPYSDIPRVTIERPLDVTRVLDYAEMWTAADGTFADLIDFDRVAVSGQSYGGYTALAAAGARIDFAAYREICDRVNADPTLEGLLCPTIVPHEADMAQMAGFGEIPTGLWPSLGDPRVKAVVPMAGDAYLFGDAGLAEVTVPMLALGGTEDYSTPYAWGARLAYEHVSSTQRALVSFEEAGHFIFLAACDDNPWVSEIGFSHYCSDPVWDLNRSHDLINHFTTAFLLDTLYDDAEAHAALSPDAVAFPGITYEAVGF